MMYNNKKLALSILWIVLGITLMGLSISGIPDSSVYSGMGGGLIAVGALQVIRNLKYRNNPEYKEEIDIKTNDERNKHIRMKSWSWTGYIVVLGSAVASVVAMMLGKQALQMYLSYTVCITLVIYWMIYIVVSKRY